MPLDRLINDRPVAPSLSILPCLYSEDKSLMKVMAYAKMTEKMRETFGDGSLFTRGEVRNR